MNAPSDTVLEHPDLLIQDAAKWRELVHLLQLWGWKPHEITPARIKQQIPPRWPYGAFAEPDK